MLHIISRKLNRETINRILEMTDENDAFVLAGDGIYGYPALAQLKHYSALHNDICYLEDDARLRGFSSQTLAHLHAINYEQFVDLTLSHEKSLTW